MFPSGIKIPGMQSTFEIQHKLKIFLVRFYIRAMNGFQLTKFPASPAILSHQTPHQSCVLSHLHTLSLSRQEYWATNKYVFTVLNHLKLQKIKTFPSSVVCLQEGIIHKIDR